VADVGKSRVLKEHALAGKIEELAALKRKSASLPDARLLAGEVFFRRERGAGKSVRRGRQKTRKNIGVKRENTDLNSGGGDWVKRKRLAGAAF